MVALAAALGLLLVTLAPVFVPALLPPVDDCCPEGVAVVEEMVQAGPGEAPSPVPASPPVSPPASDDCLDGCAACACCTRIASAAVRMAAERPLRALVGHRAEEPLSLPDVEPRPVFHVPWHHGS